MLSVIGAATPLLLAATGRAGDGKSVLNLGIEGVLVGAVIGFAVALCEREAPSWASLPQGLGGGRPLALAFAILTQILLAIRWRRVSALNFGTGLSALVGGISRCPSRNWRYPSFQDCP